MKKNNKIEENKNWTEKNGRKKKKKDKIKEPQSKRWRDREGQRGRRDPTMAFRGVNRFLSFFVRVCFL